MADMKKVYSDLIIIILYEYYLSKKLINFLNFSLGNYILLNVFLAIAVDNLSTEEDDEGEAPDEEKVNKQTNK